MNSLQELELVKGQNLGKLALKEKYNKHIFIYYSHEGGETRAGILESSFRKRIEEIGVRGVALTMAQSVLPGLEPYVVVYPEGTLYGNVTEEDACDIVEKHIKGGKIVHDKILGYPIGEDRISQIEELPYYHKGESIALRLYRRINPENILEYISFDGYMALEKAIHSMNPKQVINEIKESGLRGRGGGGFPTGTKLEFAHDAESDQKYIVCNADEGDPGAFMDRSILEYDPHCVLEAMAIQGYAIGANQGFIYLRAEYPVAENRLKTAISQARHFGFLGNGIFGSQFCFNVELRLGAGAFVCGEETALLNSIEGHRGMPRPRPPFPAISGLWGKPTIINNVETLANIAPIILKGADWFRDIGTEDSSGTKVFALGGKISHTGLVEIPMGTTLREVIYDIGGGIPGGKKFKAVQTGGPSGGCIPEADLDTPIDYKSLAKLGSMMGSGGMVVMDEDNCMVDIAKFFLGFTVDESCGKCPPCRIGTKRMYEILDKICKGRGTVKDIDNLHRLAKNINTSSLCALGQTAANPVLSTIKHFRHEYESHVNERICPAAVCQELMHYVITESCIGCGICRKNCPTEAIKGENKELHVINQDMCTKCGVCLERCPFKSIIKKQDLMHYVINDSCNGCGVCRKDCPYGAIEGENKELHVINQNMCDKCGTCVERCPSKSIVKK